MPQAGVNEDNSDSIFPKICDSLDDLASVVAGSYKLAEVNGSPLHKPRTKECTSRAHGLAINRRMYRSMSV